MTLWVVTDWHSWITQYHSWAPRQCSADASHTVRSLGVEKLKHPTNSEHIRKPQQNILPQNTASPNPILLSGRKMSSFAEISLSKMCTEHSYKGMETSTIVKGITDNDWIGISKLFIVLPMMFLCCTSVCLVWLI